MTVGTCEDPVRTLRGHCEERIFSGILLSEKDREDLSGLFLGDCSSVSCAVLREAYWEGTVSLHFHLTKVLRTYTHRDIPEAKPRGIYWVSKASQLW